MLESKIKAAVEKFKGGAISLAIDWIVLIGIIAEVLLPLLEECFSPEQAAKRMKRLSFVDRTRLRLALRTRIREEEEELGVRLRPHVSKIVDALEEVAKESTEEELQQVYQEAIS